MFDTNPSDDGPTPDEPKRLVCGVCERLFDETFENETAAEDFAAEHEADEHPDRDHVVVVPISPELVNDEGPEGVIEIAKGAQQRLDEGDVGEGMGL